MLWWEKQKKNLQAELSPLWEGWQIMCYMHWVMCPNAVLRGQQCWAWAPGLYSLWLLLLVIIIIFIFLQKGEGNNSHTVSLPSCSSDLPCSQQGCQDWRSPSARFLSPVPVGGLPRAVRRQQLLRVTSAMLANSALQLGIRGCSGGVHF